MICGFELLALSSYLFILPNTPIIHAPHNFQCPEGPCAFGAHLKGTITSRRNLVYVLQSWPVIEEINSNCKWWFISYSHPVPWGKMQIYTPILFPYSNYLWSHLNTIFSDLQVAIKMEGKCISLEGYGLVIA